MEISLTIFPLSSPFSSMTLGPAVSERGHASECHSTRETPLSEDGLIFASEHVADKLRHCEQLFIGANWQSLGFRQRVSFLLQ